MLAQHIAQGQRHALTCHVRGTPQSLRAIAAALEPLGPTACFYLAAAVSDFYLPWADMAQHKIQSSDGPLELRLPKVPKMVAALRQTWAPRAFVVSFKLETDETILLRKVGCTCMVVHALRQSILHLRSRPAAVPRHQGMKGLWIVRSPMACLPARFHMDSHVAVVSMGHGCGQRHAAASDLPARCARRRRVQLITTTCTSWSPTCWRRGRTAYGWSGGPATTAPALSALLTAATSVTSQQ